MTGRPVNYEKLPDAVMSSVEVIQGDASEDEEVMQAVVEVMKYAKDCPDLRIVLVDCLLLRSQRTVSFARSALEEAAEESDIPVILKVSLRRRRGRGVAIQSMMSC